MYLTGLYTPVLFTALFIEPAKQTGAKPIPEKRNSTQDMGKKKKEEVPVRATSDNSGDHWDTEDEEDEEEEEESEWERSGKVR